MGEFTRFYEENHALVLGVAQRRLGSLEDAEDLASDAFRLAWARFEAGGELSVPWLYGVVRNLVGTAYRSRSRRSDLQRQINADYTTTQLNTGPEDSAEVRDAVNRLPENYRHVVVMTYWEGLTAPEIAAILGTSPGAVRTRLTRAREQLAEHLGITEHEHMEEVR